jgi:hypothetical protein
VLGTTFVFTAGLKVDLTGGLDGATTVGLGYATTAVVGEAEIIFVLTIGEVE